MKVVVYAISKNEENFVDRWVESMNEADEIYVLDTGSTDSTVNKLQTHGVNVHSCTIIPWRFDEARNKSLELIPGDTDICVCTDLDEIFNPGWRKELEKIWNKSVNRIKYNYNWSISKEGKPLVNFYIEKIHSYGNYCWIHPVHEVLSYKETNEIIITTDNITLNHYPDKNKSRNSYLKLLELSVKESPFDDRNMHYLGREYMYYKKWNKAINVLIKHLNLPAAKWKDERSASMRFIARCYIELNRYDESKMWYLKAIDETPYLREPYIEYASLCHNFYDYVNVVKYVNKALKIKTHEKTYINELFCWNEYPYDLLSIAYYNLKKYKKALTNINKAIKLNKQCERLKNNKKLIIKKIKEV